MLAQLLKLTKKRGKSMKPFCKYWRIRAPENLRFFLRGNLILDIITLYNDELWSRVWWNNLIKIYKCNLDNYLALCTKCYNFPPLTLLTKNANDCKYTQTTIIIKMNIREIQNSPHSLSAAKDRKLGQLTMTDSTSVSWWLAISAMECVWRINKQC